MIELAERNGRGGAEMSENYNEIIAALLERVSVLERELSETRKLLAKKDAVIAAQSARIKELEERLGKNT